MHILCHVFKLNYNTLTLRCALSDAKSSKRSTVDIHIKVRSSVMCSFSSAQPFHLFAELFADK